MARHLAWLTSLVGAAMVSGCSGEGAETIEEPPRGCAPGEYEREDGVCAAPGLPPDMPCPPGEWLREMDGSCIPAGVPPDGCGAGFMHDGDRGCEPLLPAEPCAKGLMAVPGETRCREIAPCGTAPWGDIPVDGMTEYVDANAVGGDGSPAAPWTTIQQGITAAASGAIVAIAAGTYVEDVVVSGKAVRLWGRCPELVELRGTAAPEVATLFIMGGASGTEVHRMGITGQALGIALSGSENVVVEETWIHDNAARGMEVTDSYGPTSITLRGSLLERNLDIGLMAIAVPVEVDRIVVRDTLPDPLGGGGRGIGIQDDASAFATATVKDSLVERNDRNGFVIIGSEAEVDGTVIRDMLPAESGIAGRGLSIEDNPETLRRATVSLRRSLVERNPIGTIVYNADVTLDATVVRDCVPPAQTANTQAVAVQSDPVSGGRGTLTLQTSLVDRNHATGVYTFGADLTVDASAVRGTMPNDTGLLGRAIAGEDDPASGARATIHVTRSVVENNTEVGIFAGGSDLTVEATAVRDSLLAHGKYGHAIQVQSHTESGAPASLVVRSSLLERSVESAVTVVGVATAEIDTSVLRATASNNGFFGDGLVVWSFEGASTASLSRSRIEDSDRAAVSNFGANVSLESSLFMCQAFDLDVETWMGVAAVYSDLGGVFCGCPNATTACHAQSHQLEPPPLLE